MTVPCLGMEIGFLADDSDGRRGPCLHSFYIFPQWEGDLDTEHKKVKVHCIKCRSLSGQSSELQLVHPTSNFSPPFRCSPGVSDSAYSTLSLSSFLNSFSSPPFFYLVSGIATPQFPKSETQRLSGNSLISSIFSFNIF